VGVILGSWVLDLLLSAMANDDTPNYALTAGLDGPVMLFALGVTLLTGFLFGLYPAWAAARGSASATLKEDSANASASRHGVRARKVLVTAQVAISILLLIPMGLFLKSLVNLMSVDLGLKTEHLMTFGLSPELNGYKPEQSRALFIRLEEQLSAVPGFTSVTSAMVPLIAGNNWGNSLDVEGFARGPGADNHSNFNLVGPGFLGKMGIPLVKAREFTESDTAASPKVGIVNETWAKHFFKGQNPIGRKFGPDKEEIEIVGVVKDSNYSSVRQKPPRLYFLPYRQQDDVGTMSFYVRSSLPPAQVAAQIRRVVSAADPDLPIEEMRTMDEQISRNIRSDRLVLQLACAFGVLATLLAMLGLYGVMAFGVTRRTREIGIRMAMGANAGSIRSLVLREVAVILAFGILLGVPAALALSRLAESQLFGVKAYDLGVVVAALFALSLAAVLAGLVPAYRASRVNPVEALRYE